MPNAERARRTDADIARFQEERARWEAARARLALELIPGQRHAMPIAFGAAKRRHPCDLSGGEGKQQCSNALVAMAGYRVCTMHAALVDEIARTALSGALPPRAAKSAPRTASQRDRGARAAGEAMHTRRLDRDAAQCRRRIA